MSKYKAYKDPVEGWVVLKDNKVLSHHKSQREASFWSKKLKLQQRIAGSNKITRKEV